MSNQDILDQLLAQLLSSGGSPEEVCSAHPELLPELKDQWQRVLVMRDELDACLPPMSDGAVPSGKGAVPLPQVPGYEVEAVIGRGGMGVVFRARHVRLNRSVALKMALAGAYAGARERERFQREAEAVAALRHPNVVQVYDVGDSDGRPYFTMELVDGGSLAQKLGGVPLPCREAAALVAALASAVHAAHGAGIVHRDLKPANVLLAGDGTPKVSDFGLARRLDSGSDLTRTGTVLGTPSYMAPEQARSTGAPVGFAADIYALGAILYEALTGRPPFRAETGSETLHQVLSRDPVPPARLNAKVPRDLETICLTCLHKEPGGRYATAAALGDDLNRFLRGETIAARPEGLSGRLARRVRCRPVLSAAVAVATLSTVALVGVGLWGLSERAAAARESKAKQELADAEWAATERAAGEDLDEMARYLRTSSWTEARTALERVRGRLGERGPTELRQRLDRDAQELALGRELDAISLRGSLRKEGVIDYDRADGDYEAAFRSFGQVGDNPEAVAERIAATNVAKALLEALDHWAIRVSPLQPRVPDPPRKLWILEVARATERQRADRDPTGWRDRARDPAVLKGGPDFDKLISETRFPEQSVPLLLALAQRLNDLGKYPLERPFLKRVQDAHPGDFWANYALSLSYLRAHENHEAIRYAQAALAVRPRTAALHDGMGLALFRLERTEEAIEQYRKSLGINPNTVTRAYLAIALAVHGPFDEAIAECRQAVEKFPDHSLLHTALGTALQAVHRDDEALGAFQKAVELDPERLDAHGGLRRALINLGRQDDALRAWGKSLEIKPAPAHQHWYGYAETCLYLRKEAEYRSARRALLATFGATTSAQTAERTARACLLLPVAGDELRQATALADRAAAADRVTHLPGLFPHFLFVKGLAEYRQGRFDQAVNIMRGEASRVPGPSPRLVLAMALHKSGQSAEARKKLAEAVMLYDWRDGRATSQDGWIAHILRREAERMILPDLPDFLAGKHQPRDDDERRSLLGVCLSAHRNRAAARLYSDIFAADPRLAADFRFGHCYYAACCAALAGCGRGADVELPFGEPERKVWRAQAQKWLRSDLTAWSNALAADPAKVRDLVRQRLTQWRAEPDLAPLREPSRLEKVPADERKDWLALWAEVDAVIARAAKLK